MAAHAAAARVHQVQGGALVTFEDEFRESVERQLPPELRELLNWYCCGAFDLGMREWDHEQSRVAMDRLLAGVEGGWPIPEAVQKLIGDGMIERAIAVLINDPHDREFLFARGSWNGRGRQVIQLQIDAFEVERTEHPLLDVDVSGRVLGVIEQPRANKDRGPTHLGALARAMLESVRRNDRQFRREYRGEFLPGELFDEQHRALERGVDGTVRRRAFAVEPRGLVARCLSIGPMELQCNLGQGHQGPHVPWEGNPPTNVIPWVDDPDREIRERQAAQPIDARDFRSPRAAFAVHAFIESSVTPDDCAVCGEHRDHEPHLQQALLDQMVRDLPPIPTEEQLNARRAELGMPPLEPHLTSTAANARRRALDRGLDDPPCMQTGCENPADPGCEWCSRHCPTGPNHRAPG